MNCLIKLVVPYLFFLNGDLVFDFSSQWIGTFGCQGIARIKVSRRFWPSMQKKLVLFNYGSLMKCLVKHINESYWFNEFKFSSPNPNFGIKKITPQSALPLPSFCNNLPPYIIVITIKDRREIGYQKIIKQTTKIVITITATIIIRTRKKILPHFSNLCPYINTVFRTIWNFAFTFW